VGGAYKTMEDEIFQYRLKSARRKKRLQKWGREKELRRTNERSWELHMQKRELGYIKLEKPVLAGWERYFVLRPDVARSKEAAFYQKILDKINTIQRCKRKDFMVKHRVTKKLHPKEQFTRRLETSEFVKCGFTEGQKALFEQRIIRPIAGFKYKVYVFMEEWRFEFRIRKHYITHAQIIDNVLEQEISELDKVVGEHNARGVLNKVYGYSRYVDYSVRNKLIERERSRTLKEILLNDT
jgi:hypothetical protein